MKKVLLSSLIVLSLSACSTLESNLKKAVKPFAKAANKYCLETDERTRDESIIPELNRELESLGDNAHIDKSICVTK